MFSDDQAWFCLPGNFSHCQCCKQRGSRRNNFHGVYTEMQNDESLLDGEEGVNTWSPGNKDISTLPNKCAHDRHKTDSVKEVNIATSNHVLCSENDIVHDTVDTSPNELDEAKDEGIVVTTNGCSRDIPKLNIKPPEPEDCLTDCRCDLDSGCDTSAGERINDDQLLSPPPDPHQPLFVDVSERFPLGNLAVSPNSPEQEDEFRIEHSVLLRSSSLKTTKTPPGTPGRKKAVRFADALGLDLESVRHILAADIPPRIPTNIIDPLNSSYNAEPCGKPKMVMGDQTHSSKYLSPNFPQPGASFGFLDRVNDKKVCLENCIINDRTVSCTVRVSNIGYHKALLVRYTLGNWATQFDVNATYVSGSCDGPTDRFTFTIVAPQEFTLEAKIEFCLQYIVSGHSYWDNNYGVNYQLECCSLTPPDVHHDDGRYLHFM